MILLLFGGNHSFGQFFLEMASECIHDCRRAGAGHQHCTGADGIVYREKGRGACRVHGGGFAGVIMAMIPNDLVDEYTEYIENAIGEGNVYRMSIRPHGAICVSERI